MRSLKIFLSVIGLAIVMPAAASAASQNFDVTVPNTQEGMVMSLTSNTGVAAPADTQNASSLLGVASRDDQSFDLQPGQVSIKTDGVALALVSTLNGDVNVGDRITASSIVGVGAKATGSAWIVGIAQGSLDSSTKGAVKSEVTDSKGTKHNVYVSRVPVLVKPTYYTKPTDAASQKDNALVPDGIQEAADKLAGKHVNALAILLAFLMILIGLFLAAQLVNAAIRNGFAAIARQPLTKFLIMPKVYQSFALAAGIIILVLVGAFLIIKLF
jgi:F0F1-type ATP synthase membrane subunit c/vacuolar-type H+-ATPase subunit K